MRSFYNCNTSVTEINQSFFGSMEGIDQIEEYIVALGNPKYESADGVLYTKGFTEIIRYPLAKADADYTIPATVIRIQDSAFRDNVILTSVVIPDSVTSIGELAFYGCSSILGVVLGKNVETIETYAFYDCSRIVEITIPDDVKEIGVYAFGYDNTNIKKVIVPNGVTSIHEVFLGGWYGLRQVEEYVVASGNTIYESADGVLFTKGLLELIRYPRAKADASYTTPMDLTLIRDDAFRDNEYLTSASSHS